MKLISLVNSGESLEKTVALVISAYKSNYSFYSKYDEVIVLYSHNIMKSKKDNEIVGTVSSIFKTNILQLFYKWKINDIYELREEILSNLYNNGKITKRQKDKLLQNKTLFIKIVNNMSWLECFPNIEKELIRKVNSIIPNVKFLNIGSTPISEIIKMIPHYQRFGKIYFYDYNGSTIQKKVSKITKYENLSNYEEKSFYNTFNVYIFLIIACKYINDDVLLGYRPMNNTYRKSYAEVLNFILNKYDSVIVEPRNIVYNKELGKYPFCLGDNVRTFNAVYRIVKDFLDNN